MGIWVPAAREHIPLFQQFQCVEKPAAEHWHAARQDVPWDRKVQSLIRNIRSPLQPPEHCYIRLSQDGTCIEAVIAFFDEPLPANQHHFHLNVMARHLLCKSAGCGQEALQVFHDLCYQIVETLPVVTRVVLTAEAHKANKAVHALLRGTDWQKSSKLNPDPNYENWEAIVDVAPPHEPSIAETDPDASKKDDV